MTEPILTPPTLLTKTSHWADIKKAVTDAETRTVRVVRGLIASLAASGLAFAQTVEAHFGAAWAHRVAAASVISMGLALFFGVGEKNEKKDPPG